MSDNLPKTRPQNTADKNVKPKKVKKLYRCLECTNSVTLTIDAEVGCTRCGVLMRLFEAEQSGLFAGESD